MVKGPAPLDQGVYLMHLSKGKEYFDQSHLQKAREELEAAYHLRPQDEKVLNLLGMTYFKLEMLPQAEEMYATLAANNPEVYTLQSNLGLIRLKLDKLKQAEGSLQRALELQPSNPKAHFYLGLLYERMENWEQSLYHFEQAKADKMAVRIRERLEEEKAKKSTSAMLPFAVMEVIAEQEKIVREMGPQSTVEIPVPAAPVVTAQPVAVAAPQGLAAFVVQEVLEEPAAGEEPEKEQSTGKMRRVDFMQAAEQLEKQRPPVPPVEEEELVEDVFTEPQETVPVEEGKIEEEKVEEQKIEEAKPAEEVKMPLERTQPSLRIPEEVTAAVQAEEEARATVEPPIEQAPEPVIEVKEAPAASLFIAEETAADISTFLAQTIEQQGAEEEEEEIAFIQPPPTLSPFVVSQEPATGEVEASESEELFETPIPTPDEIEEEQAQTTGDEATAGEAVVEQEEAEQTQAEGMAAGGLTVTMEMPAQARISVQREEAVAEVEPPRTAVPAFSQPVIEPYRPANLDQFSRDRFYVQPLIGADRFLLIDPHLLEIIISEKMYCRKGTISSFTGNLNFQKWQDSDEIPLMQAAGTGILFLADRRKEIFIISLNNETIFIEANHLLVAQAVLSVEPQVFREDGTDRLFSMIKVSGRGTIAITCQTKPLTLNVFESMPANIPADALIAWSGRLIPEPVVDADVRELMLTGTEEVLMRFSGNGDVVVEQGSLWGDRRAMK